MDPARDQFRGTGRFQLLRRLGQGGMGVVHEAFDRERHVRVALKTIRQLTPDSLLRFKHEFRVLQDLQHPNLVRLDELFEADGTWFFTMELIEGVDLLTYVRLDAVAGEPALETVTVRRPDSHDTAPTAGATEATVRVGQRPSLDGVARRPVDELARSRRPAFHEGRLREALRQLAVGLGALHDAGKVHRDVKPGNVLVGGDGRVVLLDFGLVTDAFPEGEGRTVGTVVYMAPEQITDEPVGPAADWYAVGVTLYLALTGRTPFAGTADEVAWCKRTAEPVPPGDLVDDVPADLERLCVDLLRRNPNRRPDGAEVLRRLGGAAAPGALPRAGIFVGRADELARLREALADTAAGGAIAVLVHGESGVGKSALVRRFLDDVAATGAVVLAGRCYERESVPYKALDQVIDGLSRHLAAQPRAEVDSLLPDRIGAVARVFPALRKVPAIEAAVARDAGSTADPTQGRVVVFAALRELWARLAWRQPLVVSVDDLQWADADSLALLSQLVQGAPSPPLLLCATVRTTGDGDGADIAALAARLGGARPLFVDRLPPESARALVDRLVHAANHPAAAAAEPLRADDVAAEAGGHPMFIEAVVRHRLRYPGAAGPIRLDDALVALAAEVEPAAARLLELVCVAGQPIAQETCGAAAELPFGEVARLVTSLRAAHLVKTHGVRRGDPVEVYHDRVREAVIARLPTPEQRGLHLRLGRALESGGSADPESLAVHFEEGGAPEAAARYAVAAAERASAALAFEQAVRLYRRALELDGAGPAVPSLRIALAEALGNAGRGREAAEAYLAAAAQAGPEDALDLRRRAAEQLLISGRIDDGLRELRTVLDLVHIRMPRTPRRALVSLLIRRARLRLRPGGRRARLRTEAEVPPELLRRVDTCWSASMGLAIVDTIRGADFQARHLELALEAGEPYRLVCALAAEASFSAASGGRARARTEQLVAEVDALAARFGHPNAFGFAAFAAGTADYLFGHWRRARAHCDRAADLFRRRGTGVTWWTDASEYFGLECLAYGGEYAELCRRVPALLADAQARGDLFAATNLRVGLPSMAWLIADDVDGARRNVAEAMAAWSHEGFHIQHVAERLALGQADLYEGDGPGAYRRCTEAWAAITGAVIFRVQLTRIATYHQRARAAVAAAAAAPARSSERRALVADARRAARRIAHERMAWLDPLAALARAGAAHLDGDDATAALELGAAAAGFDRADMSVFAAVARLHLGRLEGGDAGAVRIADATAALEAATIRRPERIAAMLAPGFDSSR